ncbi:exonuclease domain-containing protein [Shewanella algae]|uniref:exonuclease domain-containing protein n=1 Tax=Shewanella algae TaxID=38313 RepID=UPI000C32ED7D|nr:exonuclease domain-containing protein [Shewanella algae]MBO2641090.1 3'-5' exonuclease [Shewanella algae]
MPLLHRTRLAWHCWQAREPLKSFYQALSPVLSKPVAEAPLMALDLEMTGLEPGCDQILSIGVVPINKGRLELSGARHKLVSIAGSVGQSATIHGIMDRHLEQGALAPEQLLPWLLRQSQGRILLMHHAPLDCAFLSRLCLQAYGTKLHLPVIDTLLLEKTRLQRQQEVLPSGSLRLGASRSRYHLPPYSAHNALTDALACGELFLAQSCDAAKEPVADFLSWV